MLLEYPAHQNMKRFVSTLNHFYIENSPMWEVDFTWEGFQWISNDDYTQSCISFRRIDKSGNEIIIVCNFQPVLRENYRIGVPFAGTYKEVLNTEWSEFGGCGISNGTAIVTDDIPMHGHEQSMSLTLPPLSVMYFKCIRKKPKRKPRKLEVAVKTPRKKAEKAEAAETEAEAKPKRTRKSAKKTEAPFE